MSEECHELKNIKYKTMLISGKNKELSSTISEDMTNLDIFLQNESNNNKKEVWTKLDKSIKLDKITDFIKILKDKHKLNSDEFDHLKTYLNNCLEKKGLARNKDIDYDKDTGKIKSIPQLCFNGTTRKFTLKKHDKHVSTAKCLGPKKKRGSPRGTKKNTD